MRRAPGKEREIATSRAPARAASVDNVSTERIRRQREREREERETERGGHGDGGLPQPRRSIEHRR